MGWGNKFSAHYYRLNIFISYAIFMIVLSFIIYFWDECHEGKIIVWFINFTISQRVR